MCDENHLGNQAAWSASVVRFGPYELDRRSAELRKNGAKIRLQEQPFQILVALLERPGEVVLREEIRQKLWPDDTVVEFDHGINAAIKRLRDALSETAEKPRYVETVARRGYRFIAELKGQPSQPPKVSDGQDKQITSSIEAVASAAAKAVPIVSSTARMSAVTKAVFWLVATCAALTLATVGTRWRTNGSSVPATRTVPLTYYPGDEFSPSFSPDGNQVAFTWNGGNQDNYDIYSKTVGSNAEPSRLTTDPGSDTQPSWSPDGKYIAFLREDPMNENAQAELVLLPVLQGGPERKLGKIPLLSLYLRDRLSWSPDSRSFAFTKGISDVDSSGIWTVKVDSGEQKRLTTASADTFDCCPAFSPDGSRLIFWRGTVTTGALFLLPLNSNTESAGPIRQLALTGVGFPLAVDWMPDGRLLYSIWNPGTDENLLFQIGAQGGTPVKVPAITEAQSFAIARRGNRLAWTRKDEHLSIFRVDLASGAVSQFARSTRSDGEPQFAPDGQRVVFISDRSGTRAIWICNSEGSGCYALATMDASYPGSPSWSSNGKKIVFDSISNAQSDIYIVSAEGGASRKLTHGPNDSARPSRSADGKWIYFASRRAGTWQIFKVPVEGGPEIQITKNGGFGPVESADGAFLYYSKRGERGIWTVPTMGGRERRVTALGEEGAWAVASTGFYLFNPLPDLRGIDYLDFARGKPRRITELPKAFRSAANNTIFTLSPDRRTALYSQINGTGEDIMLTEGFK